MFCSYMSFTVSTTYSIIASIAGVGVATAGGNSVNWGWNNGKGMGAIFGGLLIAPSISAGFGAAMYLIIKYGVLRRKNAVRWSVYTGPLFFFFVAAVCTMVSMLICMACDLWPIVFSFSFSFPRNLRFLRVVEYRALYASDRASSLRALRALDWLLCQRTSPPQPLWAQHRLSPFSLFCSGCPTYMPR